MTPDFDRLAAILQAAEELSGDERERYLAAECPPEWRAEIDSLLRAGERGRPHFEEKASALGEILASFRGTQLTGHQVGPYQLEALLGEGGIGVVYRGCHRDTGALAAVKVIPVQSGDALWRARFEREVRALQSIQHPGVVRLIEAGQEDLYFYLAMELVAGRTLRELPAPTLHEALAMARQLASALAAAHDAGVIHRDLKPENVMQTGEGRVVVIDFGLAKKEERPGATVSGIAGTFGYFSPEQVRGEPLDARTDIFSLGAILYELVSGRRAFTGPSSLATAAAILAGRRPRLPGRVPSAVANLIDRCLSAEPRQRPPAAEVEAELGRLLEARRLPTLRARRVWRAVLAAGAAACVAGTLWIAASEPPAPLFRQRLPVPGMQVFEPALAWHGDWLAFTTPGGGGRRNAWMTPTGEWKPRQLTFRPEGIQAPALSPDGSLLAFRSSASPAGIYVRDLRSGRERFAVPDGQAPQFSPDGQWLAYWTGSEAIGDVLLDNRGRGFLVPVNGGPRVPLAPALADVRYPVWAADSQRLAFQSGTGLRIWDRQTQRELASFPLTQRPLAWRTRWGRDELIYLSAGRVVSLALPQGYRTPLTAPAEPVTMMTMDRTGRIILADETRAEGLWSLAGSPPRALSELLFGSENYTRPWISADGRHLAYDVGSRAEVRDLVTGRVEPLPPSHTLTPAGRTVASEPVGGGVVWDVSGAGDVVLHSCTTARGTRCIALREGGRTRVLLEHPRLNLYLAGLSPDRTRVAFTGEVPHTPPQMFLAPAGGAPPERWTALGEGDYPRWTPDGALVFLGQSERAFPALYRMRPGEARELLHEFPEASPSPRLVRPGFFRIAAARDRLVFPLGVRTGRFYQAGQVSSNGVSLFSASSPVNPAGVSLLQKINLFSRSVLLSALTLFGAAGSASGGIVYTVTGPASWGASDATIGVAGLTTYGFETTQLPAGVSISFTRGDNLVQTYDTGFGGVLPFVFDISQDLVSTAFQGASVSDPLNPTAHAWDGTHSLVNVPAQPITSYLSGFGWGTIRITFQTPVNVVGFSVQQMDSANAIFIGTNGGVVATNAADAGLTLNGYRNGYLRIEGTAGTTINYVELNSVGDGFAIDHLAFSPQGSTATPEPGSALLLLGPLAAGWIWMRRRQAA